MIEKQKDTLGGNPGEFLTGLNDGLSHLLERTSQMIFATAIFGVVDLKQSEVRLASAGHPNPVLQRDGVTEVFQIDPQIKGPGLGVVPGFAFQELALPLRGLEGIWAFTDGIFEVLGPDGEEFGLERLCESLRQVGPGRKSTTEAVEKACQFSADDAFDDDLCLLGVDFTGGA